LILANPANGYGAADESERDLRLSTRLARMEALGPNRLAKTRSSALLSAKASDEALELVRWNMSKLSISGHSQAAHMLASGNLMFDATRYFGPVLVMCGAADTVTPEERSIKIASAYSNGYYQTLPGVGHASYVEDPALFNSRVKKFLESLDA
jgi:pimeloyl-ACP methyl ester carboxylesterase